MRKLVSVQQIRDVTPIQDADAIELVHINGWQCVAKKKEFHKCEWGLYFEIDSFLPIIPEFEFLRKSSFKKMGNQEGFRLKTIRLRGQLSQGLMLPLNTFPELFEYKDGFWVNKVKNKIVHLGDDVTELLGVEKYEPPIPAEVAGDVVGLFPNFIPKTDEERIQNLLEYFTLLKDVEFEETIKLDGTSMTVFRTFETPNEKTEVIDGINGKFGVCMRNYELKRSEGNTLWKVALNYKLHEILDKEGLEIAIQGELMGPGIQKNRESLKLHDFYIFRIWDIKNQRFYSTIQRTKFVEMVKNKYGIVLKHVPVVNKGIKIFQEVKSINEMLERAEGESMVHPTREGLVFKSVDKVNGQTVSFKAISNKFLLKGGD